MAVEVRIPSILRSYTGGAKSVESVDQPAHGAVVITSDRGRLNYRPAAGYCNSRSGDAPDTFRYRLNGGEYFEYRMMIRTMDRANPGRLAQTLTQRPDVLEFRISPTGD